MNFDKETNWLFTDSSAISSKVVFGPDGFCAVQTETLDLAAWMSNSHRNSFAERDVEQAIAALKRGSFLLKYGRRGKPKFCPFRLSLDETILIWHIGKEEKHLQLRHVSKIIPGQRTTIFQRYPRPEKEYQSFSLLYSNRSLDLICKDKDEAEIWFVALRALISRNYCQNWSSQARSDCLSSDGSSASTQRNSESVFSRSGSDICYEDPSNSQKLLIPFENPPQKRLGRALSDFLLYRETWQCSPQRVSTTNSLGSRSSGDLDDLNVQSSIDGLRVSLSSALSGSTQGSSFEDFDTIGNVLIWGEGAGEGLLGGGALTIGNSSTARRDAFWPKALKSTSLLNAQNIACGRSHSMIITKQGEVFSWGEGIGGRLGHGVEADLSKPKLIPTLSGLGVESIACGEYHSCAVTGSGNLYTWGDGIHNFGLLGHGNHISNWIPKRVWGPVEGMHVLSVSCGPWHTAAVTSAGQLFTFGDGTFGALGHGDHDSTNIPREVETLSGLRTVKVSCGVWHTAAIVQVTSDLSRTGRISTGELFTWGDGHNGQLGHGNKETRLIPSCVDNLNDKNICQVACGHSITVALTISGQVYTMGSTDYGQLGNPGICGNIPTCIEWKIKNNFIKEIACGSHHVVVLNSKSEVYTWGKGANGQLGHGDNDNRNTPTLVKALKGKQITNVDCGSNFTAVIYLHKQVCNIDHSICAGCRKHFSFKRKQHNCYNCGLVFCKACAVKKSLGASMAPNLNRPYRVCDDCYAKLNKAGEAGFRYRPPRASTGLACRSFFDVKDPEIPDPKPRGILAKLSSFDSFRFSDSRLHKEKTKLDSCKSLQCRRSITSDSSSIAECSEDICASVPGSTTHPFSESPFSVKPSPPSSMSLTSAFAALAFHDMVLDDSKQTNEDLTKEVSILREQVEVLTQRSQSLEAELETTSRQLNESTELARNEVEKNKAAKEVVKTLSNQLKELTRASSGSSYCQISGPFAENNSNTRSFASVRSQLTG